MGLALVVSQLFIFDNLQNAASIAFTDRASGMI
jgi:hypothetical protein